MKVPAHSISVIIKRSLLFPYKRPWLKSIITAVLTGENAAGPMEINCLITDDENIRKFNLRYRGIDGPTDVLSFALAEEPTGGAVVDFPPEPEHSCRLGDIIISYPRAAAQAAELGHSIADELTLLLVHGTLHLLGYDHQTANGAKKMAQREKTIIRTLG